MDAGIFWQETALLTGRQMARAQKSDVEAVITTKADSIKNPLSGQITVSTFLGKRNQYNVRTAIGEFEVSTDQESVYKSGEQVTLSLTPNKIILL